MLEERMMKFSRYVFPSLFVAMVLSWGSTLLDAQVSPAGTAVAIRGKIAALKEQELLVTTSGGEVLVKMPTATKIARDVAVKLSDITPGVYVGASAQKQVDGTFRASQINIFPEEQRGLLEGHRPQTSLPNSTMTNANVEKIEDLAVQDVNGRMLTLKFKGGEVKVFVPLNTPITKRLPGEKEMLNAGTTVSVQGIQAADGTISASQITIRADTN
jgi:hypothetical protein